MRENSEPGVSNAGTVPALRRPRHFVDVHAHVFPEKVAKRAVEALTAGYGVKPVAEPTIPSLLRVMDEAGIDVAVTVPVATRPDQVASINDWAAAHCSERIVCFGALHPDMADPIAEVERLVAMGIKGVKFQPNAQHFSPEEERLWPIYEAAQGRLVLLFHSGQEIAPLPHVYAQPAALAKVNDRFPELTLVAAHLGGYQMWDDVRRHLLGRPLYLECSYCPPRDLEDAAFRTLVESHGTKRVLFGTDFPWGDPKHDVARLSRLGLAPEACEDVAWRNAADLLRLSPP